MDKRLGKGQNKYASAFLYAFGERHTLLLNKEDSQSLIKSLFAVNRVVTGRIISNFPSALNKALANRVTGNFRYVSSTHLSYRARPNTKPRRSSVRAHLWTPQKAKKRAPKDSDRKP